ncbi:protein disulfide reductase [Variovorax gossypii]|uniref:Protein disulfide reductase n=1 Tax=Variovorax gossypii TaxID=1679495 RepID=A0A3S0QAJ7_9BURK|nr:substrate-binding domain-containing protein [Variovorax gossypii]RTQ34878.1 protein disulfide reductase [Variovorax gossypii]
MNAKFKMTALSVAMVAGLVAAGSASAQIAVGGGATLPELLYDAILPSGVGLTDFSYTGTGSGAGKTAFFTNNATAFKNESVAGTPAWGASQSVHFAGSDSAVTATERDNYNTAHVTGITGPAAWSRMIQVPAVATSVLIPYKRAGIADLDLSDAQMCAVFSAKTGGLTWGELRGTTDTTPVNVVYRLDGSGTTELLARYLVAACPGSGFTVSNSFAAVVAGAVSGGTIPANWIGATGNGGVKTAMAAADARVGYVSPDIDYTGNSNSVVAKVNGNLPVASSIQTALAAVSLPVGGASQASNPLAWVPAYSKPTPASGAGSSYPIFGTTNLLLNQCYKDANVQAKVKAFLTGLLGTTYDTPISDRHFVVLPNGSVGTNNWKTQISNVFLNASHPLGIGNANVCASIGRPLSN